MKTALVSSLLIFVFFSCTSPPKTDWEIAATQSSVRLKTILEQKDWSIETLHPAFDSALIIATQYKMLPYDSLIGEVARQLAGKISKKALNAEKSNNYPLKAKEARLVYQKGLSIAKRSLQQEDVLMAKLYHNIGLTYFNEKDYKNAINYFDSVVIHQTTMPYTFIKANNCMRLAECYANTKDLYKAQVFFEEACAIGKEALPYNTLGALYLGYTSYLIEIKNYEEAHRKIKDALLFLEKNEKPTKTDSLHIAGCYLNLGVIYENKGDFNLAESNFFNAINRYVAINRNNDAINSYLNLSKFYTKFKKYDKALLTLDKAKLHSKQVKEANNDYLVALNGAIFQECADVHLIQKEYTKALENQDLSIFYLTQFDKSPALYSILMNNRSSLLAVLSDKAKTLITLYREGKVADGDKKALAVFEQVTTLIADMRADYISDDAKLSLAEDTKPAFEKAIELCYLLYQKTQDKLYLHKAFDFAELSKGMILYENTRLNKNLPKDLQQEMEALKNIEADLTKDKSADALQDFLHKKRLFREKIKQYNKNSVFSVAAIQQKLLANGQKCLMEYFVGDSSIFCFLLDNNNISCQKWAKKADFEQNINELRQAINHEDSEAFSKTATQLYTTVVQDILATVPQNTTHLMIVADGLLNYIPFELLPQNQSIEPSKVNYLIKKYSISYAASANLLMEQEATQNAPSWTSKFAVFAPQYKIQDTIGTPAFAMRATLTREGAYALPKAQEEAQSLQKIVGGSLYAEDMATESSFKKIAPQLNIIHLAMHAITDDNSPSKSRLLFTKSYKDTLDDSDLTIEELQTLSLKADLAVLSACNTGFGKLNKGEGVLSLSRAFHYAGVPSTITSLWKVPDEETSKIMISFYSYLKEGMSKEDALRQAKLDYLDNIKFDGKAAPVYWAAFMLSGNTQPVNFPLNTIWYYIGGFILLFLFKNIYQKYK